MRCALLYVGSCLDLVEGDFHRLGVFVAEWLSKVVVHCAVVTIPAGDLVAVRWLGSVWKINFIWDQAVNAGDKQPGRIKCNLIAECVIKGIKFERGHV